MIVIFLFSAQDASVSDQQSGRIVGSLSLVASGVAGDLLTILTRKAAHIFLYFVLGVLLYNAIYRCRPVAKRAVLLAIVIACVYAISDELHQLFVPGRSGEVRDVLIDTAAATLAVVASAWIVRLLSSHKLTKPSEVQGDD